MSQSTVPQTFDAPQNFEGHEIKEYSGNEYSARAKNEFNYRPVPLLAPMTFFLGLLSALGFLGILAAPIGLVGIVIGLICILRLRRTKGEYGGMWLAVTGLLMSIACFSASTGLWAYTYETEAPKDCRRLNFTADISKKGFVSVKGKGDSFNPDVKALDGTKVFIKGYMYPEKKITGLSTFLLVKDTGQCCFGGNPAITDMILINLEPGKAANYHNGLVSVAGVFHCQPAGGPAGLMPVYTIDGAFVESSRTLF